MLNYSVDLEKLFQQCNELYTAYPVDISSILRNLDERKKEHPEFGELRRKAMIYEIGVKECDVHIFPESPFYAEVISGRERNSVTSSFPPGPGIASWMMNQNKEFAENFLKWSREYRKRDLFAGEMYTDCAHHYADAERVIRLGYRGIKKEAEACRPVTKREKEFVESVKIACDSMCCLGERFSRKAEELLETEKEERSRRNLELIARTAYRVPACPAQTFYEALAAVWFVREMCNTFEGMGFAVLGHLDRLLYPFYERDLREGRIDRNSAKELILCFLALTDARWDLTDIPGGTNATVMIGGTDSDGKVIFNDVTRMFIEAFQENNLANPKLQARVSPAHPREYLEMIGKLAGKGSNVLSVFNDPVIIDAQKRQGKKERDCYSYLAGGCQELVLQNEVNCRANVYLNLPQMLLMQFHPENWKFTEEDGLFLKHLESSWDFEEFYQRYRQNMRMIFQQIAVSFNKFEGQWRYYNPCPMFSMLMSGCIPRMMDVSEGGADYNTNNFGVSGLGTLIDSLYAIKYLVYEEKRLSLYQLIQILDHNFEGHEVLRQYILNRIPKYGTADKEIMEFSARAAEDVAAALPGLVSGHGGNYEPSLFSFYAYSWLKENTGATPDGRLAGHTLSRGINPSESTGGIDAATLTYAQKSMDYGRYPGGAVIYMDLPVTKTGVDCNIYRDVIYYFMENGGSVMDFNVVDRRQLLEARKDPENHKNIIVRVCGYSAPFWSLDKDMQDEVIARTQRE
ncbi:pyruvate formate lyase family protein [Murimonas intestini]|uniref:pyruvate formate lyase family protein n=1 Tax=Murimonas intestini TaxID=1337051 RepID=UPI001651F0D3|nr:pyruvate formate lyase family protein [Murimonas intestini]